MEYRFIIFYAPRFTVLLYEEIILISTLDEFLLMGNYLHTIDGTFVHTSAAAAGVHNMRRMRRKGDERQASRARANLTSIKYDSRGIAMINIKMLLTVFGQF